VAVTRVVVCWIREREATTDSSIGREEVTSMADKEKDRKDGKKRDHKKDGGKK
jgi:hypothetical protein